MSKQPTPFDPNTADADSIRLWVQASLDCYFNQKMGRWAFRPLERYIGVRDDLAEDLRAIYREVEPRAQVRWRVAVRDLLAMQGHDRSKRGATRVLIDFAALTRAYEVLDVLPSLASCDPESWLDQVVATAVALANQTSSARACLERLHTSPSFSSDYAGLVLVALCHVDPDEWLLYVENLAQHMNILASRLEADSPALRSFASRILDAITLSRLDCASLNRLARSSELAWLSHEWIGGPDSLLRYEAKPAPRLALRANSAQSISLKEPLAAPAPDFSEDELDDTVTDSWRKELVPKILAKLCKMKTRMTYSAVACLLDVQPQEVGKWLGERRQEASWVVRKKDGRPSGYKTWQCHPDLCCKRHVIKSCCQLRDILGVPPPRKHRRGCGGGC